MRSLPIKSVWALALLTVAGPPVAAADAEEIRSAGGVAWVLSDELDLVGEMSVDVPFARVGAVVPYAAIGARTAIEKSIGEFTFAVRHVDYDLEAGARWTSGPARGLALFVGQSGLERVDASGEPRIRVAGGSWSSAGFGGAIATRALEGSVSLAAVVESEQVDADVLARAGLRWSRPFSRGRWGIDLRAEGLGGGGRLRGDLSAGPRLDLPLAGGRSLGLYARWIRERSEIGLGASGVAAGFVVAEGPVSEARSSPPDMSGAIGVGVRDGGSPMGRLRLAVASPPTGRGVHAVLDVDAHIRTADDTGDLYYHVTLGAQQARSGRVVGGWLYHRSNHVLAEPNDRITSLNVVEGGLESEGWTRPPAESDRRPRGSLDYRARAGYLVTSRFGEERRWHVRAGVRWIAPGPQRSRPFAVLEAEDGDVAVRSVAIGLAFGRGFDVRIERRRDEQTFSREPTTTALWTSLVF